MRVEIIDGKTQVFNGRRFRLHKNQRYFKASVNKKNQYLHRMVWEYHNGKIPDGMMIDHIDMDKSNNGISNLRLVTPKQNRENIPYEAKEKYRHNMIKYNSLQIGKWWQDEEKSKSRSNKLSKNWREREPIPKSCILCGSEFSSKHQVAKYCSKECRQQNYFRNGVKLWQQKITK